ncbi:hypothetical protein MRB53_042178 [Persea americana]|nr:hypothetical protein MRB53_042178 [Persea americana]
MPSGDSSVASFVAAAHHIAGANLSGGSGRPTLSSMMPRELIIKGRLSSARADAYLDSLSAAHSTDVCVLDLIAAHDQDQAQWNVAFDYFHERERYAVLDDKASSELVKDAYILPLEAGVGNMPSFLQHLDHISIEQPRPRRMLLLVYVVKWRSPPNSADSTPANSIPRPVGHAGYAGHLQQQSAPSMSPLPGQNPSNRFSGFGHSPTNSPFPTNPYAPVVGPPLGRGGLTEEARQILGPFHSAPVIQQLLLASEGSMTTDVLRNLRAIVETNPAAQTDWNVFKAALERGAQGTQ